MPSHAAVRGITSIHQAFFPLCPTTLFFLFQTNFQYKHLEEITSPGFFWSFLWTFLLKTHLAIILAIIHHHLILFGVFEVLVDDGSVYFTFRFLFTVASSICAGPVINDLFRFNGLLSLCSPGAGALASIRRSISWPHVNPNTLLKILTQIWA